MSDKNILIIDSNSILYRCYHGYPEKFNAEGHNINALYGYLSQVRKLYDRFEFDEIVHTLDNDSAHRYALLPEYKANREDTPEDLKWQKQRLKEILPLFNQKILEVADHEADDVIATLAEKSMMNEDYVLILSNDKDILQLVNDEHTCVMKVAKNRDGFNDFVFMDERSVYDKHGVRPDQIPDFLAMVGDKPDNITGIPGVGAKTAAKLLEEHGSIENLIANSDSLKGKLKEKVQATKEDLMKFKEITVLWRDLDVPAIEELQADFNYYELSGELGLSVDDMAFWEQVKQQAQGNDVDLIQDDNNSNTAPVFKF